MANYVHSRVHNYVLTYPPVFGRKWPENRYFYYIIKKKKKKKNK